MTSPRRDPHESERLSRVLWPAISVATYLLLAAALFLHIRSSQADHFTFALDDPYIHFALAEQIAHGHYGLNPGVPASPSSSILWPLLLAAFARVASLTTIALLLNILAGAAAALLAGITVARWPHPAPTLDERSRRFVSAAVLVVVGNLVGLTFLGMEHTLQVLLAGACAFGIIACLQGRPIPTWCLVAAVVGPLVRYESLDLTLALAIALLGQHRKQAAIVISALSIAPLLIFSAFLHHIGLPLLPTSVLLKSGADLSPQHGGSGALLRGLLHNFIASAKEPHHLIVTIFFFTLLGLAVCETRRDRRFALFGATVAAGLHLLVGRFGWFHRYEVYIVFFSALIVLHVVHERPRMLLGWYVFGLLGCSYLYFNALNHTAASAHDVYLQQYQMHRFATGYYGGNIAVNDLGLASYQRRPGQQVTDLFGLGSLEVARQMGHQTTASMDAVTSEHHVGLVMVYAELYPPPPPSWQRLGVLCNDQPPMALAGPCVTYYATPQAPPNLLAQEFATFVKTLPPGVTLRSSAPAPQGPVAP